MGFSQSTREFLSGQCLLVDCCLSTLLLTDNHGKQNPLPAQQLSLFSVWVCDCVLPFDDVPGSVNTSHKWLFITVRIYMQCIPSCR